jgi:predicted  nucleic acid-binding Zn-ribbon protein
LVHPEVKAVIELQQLDSRIAELTAQIDSLPLQIRKLESELHEFIKNHEAERQRLAANQKARRDLEGDIQLIRAKISKHKDQLYEVKTNEQFRAMLREIEGEEENIRQIEDQLLEKMVEAEQLERHVKEAASRLEGEKARVEQESRRLQALCQADEQERARLLEQRLALAAQLEDRVREHYERLRKSRGSAVAEVRDGFCSGCHVRLRPQAYNEVRSNSTILTCETCGRILYYVEKAEPDVQPAAPASGASASR